MGGAGVNHELLSRGRVGHEFWCIAMLLALLCPANAEHPSATITVRVYNRAQVSWSTLAGAEAKANNIFHQAAVDIIWVHCGHAGDISKDESSCSELADPIYPVLSLVNNFGPRPGVSGETLGFAVASSGFAYISFDRISELMPYIAASKSDVLGCLIAHEIGHLLLQTRGHTPLGIMHFPWSRHELRLANQPSLVFTPEQASAIRGMARRFRAGSRAPMRAGTSWREAQAAGKQ